MGVEGDKDAAAAYVAWLAFNPPPPPDYSSKPTARAAAPVAATGDTTTSAVTSAQEPLIRHPNERLFNWVFSIVAATTAAAAIWIDQGDNIRSKLGLDGKSPSFGAAKNIRFDDKNYAFTVASKEACLHREPSAASKLNTCFAQGQKIFGAPVYYYSMGGVTPPKPSWLAVEIRHGNDPKPVGMAFMPLQLLRPSEKMSGYAVRSPYDMASPLGVKWLAKNKLTP